MRKFIISDIHGNGNLYYSVMSYIENVSKTDEVTLYINGDLIDRGSDSGEILLDIIRRINDVNNSFKIVYLGGNHELLMYEVFKKRKKLINVSERNDWYLNGGRVTDNQLYDLLHDKDRLFEVADFIGGLKIYHKFEEKIGKDNILLIHACAPMKVKDECDLKISDNENDIEYLLWTRKDDPFIPFRCRIGNYKDFSIVGHTPNNCTFGYFCDENEKYLNIDGGCAYYVSGRKEYNHYPLVEIKDGYLKILTFNSNNEITYGNYFENYNSTLLSDKELEYERSLLNKELKLKRVFKS